MTFWSFWSWQWWHYCPVHRRGRGDEPAVQQQGRGDGAQGRGGLRQDRLRPRGGPKDVRQALRRKGIRLDWTDQEANWPMDLFDYGNMYEGLLNLVIKYSNVSGPKEGGFFVSNHYALLTCILPSNWPLYELKLDLIAYFRTSWWARSTAPRSTPARTTSATTSRRTTGSSWSSSRRPSRSCDDQDQEYDHWSMRMILNDPWPWHYMIWMIYQT